MAAAEITHRTLQPGKLHDGGESTRTNKIRKSMMVLTSCVLGQIDRDVRTANVVVENKK